MLNSSVPFEEIKLLGATDAAAERKDSAFFGVFAGRRMRHTQRTIDAMAIFDFKVLISPVIVAVIAHIVGSEATEKGD